MILRAGMLVAALRTGCVWFAVLAGNSSGPEQLVAYLLLLLTLPEAIVLSGLAGRPLLWAVFLSALVIAGSFLWVALLVAAAWPRRRPPSPGAP